MTEEQEETIETLYKDLELAKKEDSIDIDVLTVNLETVLKEIEKYQKLLADNLAKDLNNNIKAKNKANKDLEYLNEGWKLELEKKDKMIDLYIDELVTNMFDRCCQECCRECEKDKDTLRSCIKQYFKSKAEKE